MGETAELLAKIAGAMAALLAAAKAWAKLNQNTERREDRAALKQVNDALREENERCKRDLLYEKERKEHYRNLAHDVQNEKQELYDKLDEAHTDMTVLRLQLDAERMARLNREGRDPPREEA